MTKEITIKKEYIVRLLELAKEVEKEVPKMEKLEFQQYAKINNLIDYITVFSATYQR